MISQKKEKETRSNAVDLAAGILILWIMMFHAMNGSKVFGEVDARVALPFLTFSMPWFFYKSGFFFSPLPAKQRLAKDTRKLLWPFLKWTLLGYLLYMAMQVIDGTVTWQNCVIDPLQTFYIYGYLPANVPLWFVLSLIFVRVISNCLLNWKIPAEVLIVICIAIGYALPHDGSLTVPFYISNISMGIAFFMVGRRFGEYENNRWLLAICVLGYVAFLVFGCSIVGHHRNVLLEGHYLLWPLFAYCGIVIFNNLCMYADRFLSDSSLKDFRPLTFIGRHTLTLLVSHALIYVPVLHYSKLSPWQTVGIIVLGYLCLLAILVWSSRRKIIQTRQSS